MCCALMLGRRWGVGNPRPFWAESTASWHAAGYEDGKVSAEVEWRRKERDMHDILRSLRGQRDEARAQVTERDARWMAVVRRLWRQRDNLVNALRQLEATAERGDCMGCAKTADDLRYMYDQRDALRTQCETQANAYEDEHRRATLLQERVTWLENNWTPPEEPCDD